MGTVFCSYFMENNLSRLRASILNSELADIKKQLRTTNSEISYHLSSSINTEIDSEGNTPLLFSIEYQKIESFRFLLSEFRPDVNKPNGQTRLRPLHILALTKTDPRDSFKSPKITQFEYTSSESPQMDHQTESVLKPTRSFKSSKSESFIENLNAIDFEYELGYSFKQIQEDLLSEMILLLISKDADINGLAFLNKSLKIDYGCSIKTITPLMAAVIAHNVVAVKELIQAGCDCNFQDENSKVSAFHLACRWPKNEIASIIIKRGNADLSLISKNGDTCLHWLAKSNIDDTSVFQMIMTKMEFSLGENEEENFKRLQNFIDLTNDDEKTALMIAAKNNHQNLVKFLLDYNASIDLVDKNGLKAVDHGKLNSCGQLITSYAKVAALTYKKISDYSNRPDSEASVM